MLIVVLFFALGSSTDVDLVHILDLSQLQEADLLLQTSASFKDGMLLGFNSRSVPKSLSRRLLQGKTRKLIDFRSASSIQLLQKDDDIKMMFAAETHLGTKKCNYLMECYGFERCNEGIYSFNLCQTWKKQQLAAVGIVASENPRCILVHSAKPYGQSYFIIECIKATFGFVQRVKLILFSSSARAARSVERISIRSSREPLLKRSRSSSEDPFPCLGNLQMHINNVNTANCLQDQLVPPTWMCSLPIQKTLRFVLPGISSGLKTDKLFISFKERDYNYISSLWERSFPPSSSSTERTFSSLPSSFIEETIGVQPQNLPLLVDTILTGFKTRFLSNSTKFEPTFQSDSIMSIMLHRSDETHIDFYEIFQVYQDLKMCLISILVFYFSYCIRWIICFNRRVFGLIVIVCISKI